jgi:hypothetical protein
VKRIIIAVIFVMAFFEGNAQKWYEKIIKTNPDSQYYETLKNRLDVRLYTSRKYSNFTIDDSQRGLGLNYRSNSVRSLGIGASYKWLGFSFGYGFDFLNTNRVGKGNGLYLDFQTQIYMPTIAIKIFSGYYKGFYLNNSANAINSWNDGYYLRDDISASSFGLGGTYYFNHAKYSNKAAFGYMEWQKQTSGSFLVGINMYINTVKGDSSFIPVNIIDPLFLDGKDIIRTRYSAFGADCGYTFTLVIYKNWFCNLMFSTGLAYGKTKTRTISYGESRDNAINLNFQGTAGLGYNSRSLYVGISQYFFSAYAPVSEDNTSVGMQNGRFQFMVAYRFKMKKDYDLIPPEVREWWKENKPGSIK